MKHPIKVVMLPTEDKSDIHLMRGGDEWGLEYRENTLPQKDIKSQDIYITVSQDVEPIKEGDWCICFIEKKNQLRQVRSLGEGNIITTIGSSINILDCNKIIATTDPKLINKQLMKGQNCPLGLVDDGYTYDVPQVPQSFLKEFVANPDREWEVEYKSYHGINTSIAEINSISGDGSKNWRGLGDNRDFKLKLNQDNTVNITSVKEKMYSGIDLMGNQDGSLDHFLLNSTKYSQEDREIIMDAVHDWIKGNL